MNTEIIKTNEFNIQNTKLRNYTEQIFKQGMSIRKSFARVAVILVKIDESKCYEDDGYESVQDYAEKILGWKQANTYAMLRVGRDYIDNKTYESLLPHTEGSDYSTSQLQALLPLKSVEVAKELAIHNVINPSMTVKEIKEVVKQLKSEAVSRETSEEEIEDSTEDIIEAASYTVNNSIELVTNSDGTKVVICDGVEVTKESIIELIERF